MIKEDPFLMRLSTFNSLIRERKELKEKVEKLTALVNRLLDHIVNDMIMNNEPYVRLKESIREPVKED